MTLEAGTPIGKYVVKRKLAEGGMAEIYLATARGAEGFEKEVVIKRVRSFLSDDEGFVRMFINEARLVSRLNHANVVQIFDFDKHEDSYYLAMEYVRGSSLWELRKRCREKGIRMPPVLVAHVGAQVAAGLHYAHRTKSPEGEPLGLVHRDVTPHNVLLSFDGAVKLTDFGIAKAGNRLTQPGVLKGKFAYMSPEQARGEEVDARTDIFALGVVLWEMLTGGRLFDGDSEVAVLRAVRESLIVPPARLNPDVPEALDNVILTALEREPEARYQSAGEMERALAQCVLRSATSVDDTDVGTFVRRLFDVPLTQFMPAPALLQDRSRPRSGGVPPVGMEPTAPSPERVEAPAASTAEPPASESASVAPPLRESTAVLPGRTPALPYERVERLSVPEDSLVSASTLVLSRDGKTGEGPAAVPAEPAVERVSGNSPSPEPAPVAPVPPAPTPDSRRGRTPVWVGAGVAFLVLAGGVTAWRMSSAPASTPPAQVEARSPSVPVTPPSSTPPARPEIPPAAVAEQEVKREEAPAPAAPVVQAKGYLTVQAVPYADLYIDGKLYKRELQQPLSIELAPGTYQLTFKHPSHTRNFPVTITADSKVTKKFNVPRKK
ncbi:serine/threonine protein kinase [Melittangium boletus]|uniref:Protein kinase domain-containing protein n=1 Tax=Melittangium boletus DSM 14713 TaxID=1294270 RepID=A0A286NUZ7_9BACT|nr:serine/threonine-protein kinase [Melittangium boletus]ATB26864.1 hypothetical protein MEBOL_000298 [Melittangium boletus DSM 14713]